MAIQDYSFGGVLFSANEALYEVGPLANYPMIEHKTKDELEVYYAVDLRRDYLCGKPLCNMALLYIHDMDGDGSFVDFVEENYFDNGFWKKSSRKDIKELFKKLKKNGIEEVFCEGKVVSVEKLKKMVYYIQHPDEVPEEDTVA